MSVKTSASPRSGPVPNQPPMRSAPAPVVMNGMATNCAIGLIRNAVAGEADCSTLCAKPKTRPCRSYGTTRCSTVCSAASMYGITHIHTNRPAVSSTIDERSVKTAVIPQISALASSSVRSGWLPSPRRAITSPPTMKPVLRKPHSRPHASTDTSDSPYASISAMITPPSTLLIAAKTMRASSPGTARTTANVPRTSTRWRPVPSSSPAAAASSGKSSAVRCTTEAAVTASARISTYSIPPRPTSSPLITEVIRKERPEAVPTRPLARSRRSAGMSSVTAVDIAIVRMLPAITPTISTSTKTHRSTLAGSVNASRPAAR